MIIRPYGYAIWENMVNVLDKMFKKHGVLNLQMPMFIPESLLNVEKEHVEGFAPEVAWVTHGGSNLLEERMCVRPTSEVLFCDHFKKIIKSYRDLPLVYNQWCTIVRWEKTTRPFLRSREILWQEGHTMHATSEEAQARTLEMLHVYEDFQRNYLGIPVFVGPKTDKEKFAGAETTYTLEAMMYDGVALQNGTSHYFGNHFAKAFGIEYLSRENKLETPYQTSWGVTTRMIGALIMVHSDDNGLVLPPKIAPTKVCIIPIGEVSEALDNIKKQLDDKEISYVVDDSDKSPGFKFAESEVKGYPIRIELGARDLEKGIITIARRDTLEKIEVTDINSISDVIISTMDKMQNDMYEKARIRRDSMVYEVNDYETFKDIAKNKNGFLKVNWCGNVDCENKIKEDTGLKSRCIIEDESVTGNCVCCGNTAKHRIFFGKQY